MSEGYTPFLLTGSKTFLKLKIDTSRKVDLNKLREYLSARAGFLKGAKIELLWEPEIPEYELFNSVSQILREEFYAEVDQNEESKTPFNLDFGIFDDKDLIPNDLKKIDVEDSKSAIVIFGPLRSGQKVETAQSLVLVGDANHASEIVAGGDIFVLGALRGLAHAGAFEEKPKSIIFALTMVPTQLRIGSVISRGESGIQSKGIKPEVARLDDDIIVIEPYNSKIYSRGFK